MSIDDNLLLHILKSIKKIDFDSSEKMGQKQFFSRLKNKKFEKKFGPVREIVLKKHMYHAFEENYIRAKKTFRATDFQEAPDFTGEIFGLTERGSRYIRDARRKSFRTFLSAERLWWIVINAIISAIVAAFVAALVTEKIMGS